MGGYYINISVKSNDAARVRQVVTEIFAAQGFSFLGDEPASAVVEDDEKLPASDGWYGVVVSSVTKHGWVSVYVDDWQDSGLLAKHLSQSLATPALEVWVADDIHWGYTYYESGEVRDRFADDPATLAESTEEAALYRGNASVLTPILRVPPTQLTETLRAAQANAGQFAGEPLDALAQAVALPFEHLFTGYDYFFNDDPEDYADDLEDWPQFRHLAFQLPPGRETLAE